MLVKLPKNLNPTLISISQKFYICKVIVILRACDDRKETINIISFYVKSGNCRF